MIKHPFTVIDPRLTITNRPNESSKHSPSIYHPFTTANPTIIYQHLLQNLRLAALAALATLAALAVRCRACGAPASPITGFNGIT